MAKVMITESYLEDIADAIREKKGGSDTYTPGEMAEAISSIDGGSTIDMPTFTIVWNDAWDTIISVSCNKTYQECRDYCNNSVCYANLHEYDQSLTSEYDSSATCVIMSNTYLIYIVSFGNIKDYIYLDISYDIHGDIIASYPSTFLETKNVTQNGTVVASDDKILGSVVVNVPSSSPTLQNKTVNPSESQQSVQADSGYDGLDTVTVSAISSIYVGSDITRRDSDDLTVSGATVTVPVGYYESQASKSVSTMTLPTSAVSSATSGYTSKATIGRSTSNQYINIPPGYNSAGAYYVISAVANGSASAPSTISGTSATVSTGTNTLTLTKTVSVTPTVSEGYVSSGTATNSSVSLTASVATKAAATITPTTTDQTIASGTYLTGTQTIVGDSDLVGSNILSTANIFGVQGQVVVQNYYTGSSAPSSSLGSNGDLYLQS